MCFDVNGSCNEQKKYSQQNFSTFISIIQTITGEYNCLSSNCNSNNGCCNILSPKQTEFLSYLNAINTALINPAKSKFLSDMTSALTTPGLWNVQTDPTNGLPCVMGADSGSSKGVISQFNNYMTTNKIYIPYIKLLP